MKLYYIANARFPTEKAHGYQIARMCHEYSMLGYDVTLVIPSRNNTRADEIFSFYNLPHSFNVRVLAMPDMFRFEKMLGRLTIFVQTWIFFIRSFFFSLPQNAIVITRHPEIAWVAQKKGARVAYECHDWFKRRSHIALWFLHTVQIIVTTNNHIKDQFVEKGLSKNRIVVAPNGVDIDTYAIETPKEAAIDTLNIPEDVKIKMRKSFVALYTGSFTTMGTEKGISTILEALKETGKGVYFVAVGGSEKDIVYYRKLAKEKGVERQVRFHERVDQETLAQFQRATDVLLMPFPRKEHYEYFMSPLKTFEYMASGRPIIASNLPSIKDILDENSAFFTEPGDSHALAEQIKSLEEDPKIGIGRAKHARGQVQKYTWHKRAEHIASVLKKNYTNS